MSKVWILVADDMSAAHVADVASKSGAPYEALVFGDASRADAVAALGPASVTLYDTSATLAEALAPAIADRAAQEQPAAVLCSDDATARAIAGAIAVKLSAAVAAAVTSVSVSEVACTLPLCDNYHWFEHDRVVGTSTQKISPRLYLTLGSSGAPQHMTGVRGAKIIVAVNNDSEASIFRECAYGIVGDVKEIVPVLTAAIKGA